MHDLARLEKTVLSATPDLFGTRVSGVVAEVTPGAYRVRGLSPFIALGDYVNFAVEGRLQAGEVVRIDDAGAIVKPFHLQVNAGLGTPVYRGDRLAVRPDSSWKGRVVNAFGEAIDGAGPLVQGDRPRPAEAAPPEVMRRARVGRPLRTGVRVIDVFTPLCMGQRIGIFAGSGVGKSSLLAMLARSRSFDTVVIALVGERGREVREFLEDTLGQAMADAVMVVSTGDESPMMRRLAPKTAMAVAEHFRDLGQSVLLIVDSVSRFAHAARDVAFASGEPPVARGYAPSVFSELPKLLERAGPGEEGSGSITGIFSVLVDGDDHNEPISDSIRGTLDGHIVLDRAIADQGRYPAVNVLSSISRLAQNAWTAEQRSLVMRLRSLIARFEDTRDLRLMGGHQRGNDAELDQAVALVPNIYRALEQDLAAPPSEDGFGELAAALRNEAQAGAADAGTAGEAG